MPASAWRTGFEIDPDWRVWPERLEVEHAGRCQRIEPRMMDVLLALAERAPGPISRDELMQQVWAGRIVTEDSLNRIVSRLRALFEDDPREPRLIETIPRRGYRLLQRPRPIEDRPAAGATHADRAVAAERAPSAPVNDASTPVARPIPSRRPLLVAALLAGAACVAGWIGWRSAQPERSRGADDARTASAALRIGVLTAYPGRENYVAFHPRGHEFVFAWDGAEPGNRDLYRRATAGGDPERLTRDPATERAAAYAPDGSAIAFVRMAGDDCRILRLDLETREERVLATCSALAQPRLSFAPEGDRLVFNDNPDQQGQRLVELRLQDLGRRDLTSPPPGQHDYFPAISPDGRWLAFARLTAGGAQEVHRMPAAGGPAEALTGQRGFLSHLAWVRDDLLVYVSDASGANGLWELTPGQAPRPLGPAHGDVQFPAAAGDGRLAFEQVRLESQLHWFDRTSGSLALAVPPSTRQDGFGDCSVDGRTIVFSSNRSGAFGLWRMRQGDAAPQLLREQIGLGPFSPSLSPDGTQAIFAEVRGTDADICVVSVDDGAHHCLVEHPANDIHPSFLPEGAGFVFASARGGVYQLYRAEIDGSDVRRLSDTAAVAPRALPGGRLLFQRVGRAGLWLRDADGRERELHPGLPVSGFRNFDGDAERAWFFDAEARLVEVRFADGRVTSGDALPGVDGRSGLRFCAASGRFLYGRLVRDEIDLAILTGWPASRN